MITTDPTEINTLWRRAVHTGRTATLLDFKPVHFPIRPHFTVPVTPYVQFRNLPHPAAVLDHGALQQWLNQTAAHTRKIAV